MAHEGILCDFQTSATDEGGWLNNNNNNNNKHSVHLLILLYVSVLHPLQCQPRFYNH